MDAKGLTTEQFRVSVATTDSLLLGSDPLRESIVLSSGPTNHYTISFAGSAVLDEGIRVPANTQALVLTRRELGDIITGQIRAVSAVALQIVTGVVSKRMA